MLVDDGQRVYIGGKAVDSLVEAAVLGHHERMVARGDELLERVLDRLQLRDVAGPAARGRGAHHHHLQRGADLEQVFHKAAVDAAHARAAVGLDLHQALTLQFAQRLADRHMAHPIPAGQGVHGDAFANRRAPLTMSSRMRRPMSSLLVVTFKQRVVQIYQCIANKR